LCGWARLSPEQEKQLDQALRENVAWSHTNTCASWATATTAKERGQRLDAGELMLTDTPRELIESIRAAERLHPTSPAHPQPPAETRQERSGASSLSGLSVDLHQQAIEGVHTLDATLGRAPDESSERMAVRAHMSVDAALQPSVDQSLQRLQQVDQHVAAVRTAPEPGLAPEQSQHRQMGDRRSFCGSDTGPPSICCNRLHR